MLEFTPEQLAAIEAACAQHLQDCRNYPEFPDSSDGPAVSNDREPASVEDQFKAHQSPQPMTILCDYEIKALCTDGMVQNYEQDLINPASLDLRLGDTIMIESAEDLDMRPLSIAGRTAENPYELKPGQFVLAQTIEVFNMPENIAGLFFLKSSRAREGYENLHAGYADPGWHGSVLTLELKNSRQLLPLPLYPGMKIGQMVFFRMSQQPVISYSEVGHYNQHGSVMGSVAA
jgi:dCTP deaminase